MKFILLAYILIFVPVHISSVIKVGPTQQYKTISSVSSIAQNDDIIQIESGDYYGDVAVWLQTRLTFIGEGTVRIFANGKSAEKKAIWVFRNGIFTVTNIEFHNCSVPNNYGAGIRFENGILTVIRCKFLYNQQGILTTNNNNLVLNVHYCEFGYNGAGDGYSHSIYVGRIFSFNVTGSYFHHGKVGHLIKSRASKNYIFYNRITDETGGTASYEIDLPNRGEAYIIGNLIEQSPTTQNSIIISYGDEERIWGKNSLMVLQNTIVNDYSTGYFLKVVSGSVLFANNILVGPGGTLGQFSNDLNLIGQKYADFANASLYYYQLLKSSKLIGKTMRGIFSTVYEYVHPMKLTPVTYQNNPGAFQTTSDAIILPNPSPSPNTSNLVETPLGATKDPSFIHDYWPKPVSAPINLPFPLPNPAFPQTAKILRVGPNQTYKNISAVASAAKDDDVIIIDSGDYFKDVATWSQRNLKIVGDGPVRLIANGANAQGKAIWVIQNGNIVISNIHFMNCSAPDKNGAGIRFENGTLTVIECTFMYNENGILTAAGSPNMILNIINCEFGYNGYGDGYSHNIYVNRIGRLNVTGSYFHHAKVGHLLKSRAANSYIYYNRLTDEIGGSASYEIDLPNGGNGFIFGNLIEQSATTQNSIIISYGEEGLYWTENHFTLMFNTIVNDRPQGGNFFVFRNLNKNILICNNLFIGNAVEIILSNQYFFDNYYPQKYSDFVSGERFDYHLRKNSSFVGKSSTNSSAKPNMEYVHPKQARIVRYQNNPGAFQDY